MAVCPDRVIVDILILIYFKTLNDCQNRLQHIRGVDCIKFSFQTFIEYILFYTSGEGGATNEKKKNKKKKKKKFPV